MPIARPRRIFRSGVIAARTKRRRVPAPLVLGVFGIVGIGALGLIALPASLFGRVPTLSGTLTADAQHVAVVDGDTLRVRETVVRLLGIRAPARGAGCGATADCGAAATEALASLVRDHSVACELTGRDEAGFPRAMCEAGGRSLNHALVSEGYARASADADVFAAEEAQAKANNRGFWRDGSF